jgi:ATP-dependent RNA helicase DbpA
MTASASPPATPSGATPATPTGPAFAQLPLSAATLANLQTLGYLAMTPIQAAALPLALAGRDLVAQAATGSGKTAAFALALLHRLDSKRPDTQALVLCPTRELAEQVTQEIRRLARGEDNIKALTLCGGTPIKPQTDSLAHGAHIVVGTPGRIVDHLARDSLQLGALAILVLDEADRMLDMGFAEDIATIGSRCPRARQTLLFSATYPEGLAQISRRFLRDPQEVTLAAQPSAAKIRQRFYEVREDQRLHAVGLLLNHWRPERTLAFCNTKAQCRDLVAVLQAQGVAALALHGDLEQRERDQVLIQFANRSCPVLVATDVAARGLDIVGLEAVINVEVTPDAEQHVHRVGRTGRADAEGWAFSLASLDEMGRVGRIEQLQGRSFEWFPLDGLTPTGSGPLRAPMVTLQILGGRKEKIRPGDVLGALTGDGGLPAAQIGKINVNEFSTYVAVAHEIAAKALKALNDGKVKGKKVKARLMEG